MFQAGTGLKVEEWLASAQCTSRALEALRQRRQVVRDLAGALEAQV